MMCSMHTSSYAYTILCIVHLYKKGIIQSSYIYIYTYILCIHYAHYELVNNYNV